MATLDADDLAAIANLIATTTGPADLVSVDGLTTADGAAILRLKRLEIVNDTADTAFHVANTSPSDGSAVIFEAAGYGGAALGVFNSDGGDAVTLQSYGVVGSGSALNLYQEAGGPAIRVGNDAGHGVGITAAGAGSRDVALLGSGDILGSISLDLAQPLADVCTATIGGALNGAHATAWGKVVKDVAAKLLKVFSFGSTSVPMATFGLDDGTNPTTRTPR